jgi:plasmid stability protein
MTSLTIRNVDEATKQRLRLRAARQGVSMEEEARRILKEALRPAEAPSGLGKRLRDRFAGLAVEEFVAPDRHMPRSALARQAPLATRNTTDFELIDGLEVVNPWSDGA